MTREVLSKVRRQARHEIVCMGQICEALLMRAAEYQGNIGFNPMMRFYYMKSAQWAASIALDASKRLATAEQAVRQ